MLSDQRLGTFRRNARVGLGVGIGPSVGAGLMSRVAPNVQALNASRALNSAGPMPGIGARQMPLPGGQMFAQQRPLSMVPPRPLPFQPGPQMPQPLQTGLMQPGQPPAAPNPVQIALAQIGQLLQRGR